MSHPTGVVKRDLDKSGCHVIQFVYIFKDYREVKEILLESKLSEDVHRYIRGALEYPHDSHIRVTLGEQVWIACFVSLALSSDMFREHTG